MKCRNCGAELNNGRCAYCGSVFSEDMRLFTLKKPEIDENLIQKALEGSFFMGNARRDDDSKMHKTKVKDVIEVTCIGDDEPHFIEV